MSDDGADLLACLQALEIELHQPSTRADAVRLEVLLHEDFIEIGRSGTLYSRESMFSHLLGETEPAVIVADQFSLGSLSPSTALLTYRSAHRTADGALMRHTLRSSIWQKTSVGWQLKFHQGTATAPFA